MAVIAQLVLFALLLSLKHPSPHAFPLVFTLQNMKVFRISTRVRILKRHTFKSLCEVDWILVKLQFLVLAQLQLGHLLFTILEFSPFDFSSAFKKPLQNAFQAFRIFVRE